jgi:hypothetical protein
MSPETAPSRSDETAIFLGDDSAAAYGKWMVIGGGVLFAGTILLAAVLILLPPDAGPGPTLITFVTTAPTIASVALVSLGLMLWRAPQQVDVGPTGVTVHTAFGETTVPWTDVVSLETGERTPLMSFASQKTVRLVGPQRKVLLELNDQIKPFDDLVTKLWEYASVGRDLEITDTSERKRRVEAWFLTLLGPLFAALGLWGGTEALREVRQQEGLQKHAATATATIVKHYKFNVTPRVEYTFLDADGVEYRRGTIVAENVWSRLQEGSAVQVRYLPEDPDYSRLAVGDLHDKESHDPQLMVFAGPLVALMGLVFFVGGVLQFCGVDLDKLMGVNAKKKKAY